MRLRVACAMVLASTGLSLPTAAPAAPDSADASRADGGEHLVVWEKLKGGRVQLMAADLDGSDKRVIHRLQPDRFAGTLTLNRPGTKVAFTVSAVVAGGRQGLVVASVEGDARDAAIDVLADARRFVYLGAPGWSPNGHRLVFHGEIMVGDERRNFLWSVRADGGGLRRLAPLRSPDGRYPGLVTAWTRDGIYLPDGSSLLRYADGELDRALARTSVLMLTGDGQWLFMIRYHQNKTSLWRMRTDGSDLERLVRRVDADEDERYVFAIGPNQDGTQMLSQVSDLESNPTEYVIHPIDRNPVADDPVLDFVSSIVTWR